MLPNPRRNFKGVPPKGAFQSVDIGAGHGLWVRRKIEGYINSEVAKADPKAARVKLPAFKKYAAVDPSYEYPNPRLAAAIGRLKSLGVHVSQKTGVGFLREMVRKGWKTRHINIDMPAPSDIGKYDFNRIFSLAKSVLYPGSKIFFTSEKPEIIDLIVQIGKRTGFVPGKRLVLPAKSDKTHAIVWLEKSKETAGSPIYKVVFTFPGTKSRAGKGRE